MSNGAWTDEENDLTVADYFAMLADDIYARRYSSPAKTARAVSVAIDRTRDQTCRRCSRCGYWLNGA